MPKITVNGSIVEVPKGRTLLQALDDIGLLMRGVDIPHYCWHPKLSIDGSCRLCQVEIDGMPKLQIACNTPVQEGMVVRTDTDRVRKAREGVMELLLVNHPLDCPICDQAGECKLQDYAYEWGMTESRTREPRRALKKNVELGPTIVFDQERCILCRRCVRFCREIPGTGELVVVNRGDESVIETFPGAPLDNRYSMNVADICPVGALTTRDFRFKIRVWFLQDVPGVCTGCAKGCNIHLGVANNKVHRYVPRRNDAVNDTWICDAGRMSYREIGAPDRLQQPLVRGDLGIPEAATLEAAVAEAAARLGRLREGAGSEAIAVLASPHATNEDLFVLRRFCDALGAPRTGVAVVRGEADDLLIEAEKAANAEGARRLGFPDAADLVASLRRGEVQGLLALGHDVLAEIGPGGVEALGGLDTLIVLDTHHSELQRVAHVMIPVRHAAEKLGTLTNVAGRVQRVRPAVEPPWEAHAEGAVILWLGEALELEGFGGRFDPREVSRALAASHPAFAGLDWDSVGDAGRSPDPAEGEAPEASA
jgi:NADH-quinone oxidoreductase subunit G